MSQAGLGWLSERQRDGGIDRIRLPADRPEASGSLWLCGKHAVATRFDSGAWDVIVCLVERHELDGRYPDYLGWLDRAGDAAIMAPIPDLHAPAPEVMIDLVDRIAVRLAAGQRVLVHCAAGKGRAGTTAACLLMRLGMSVGDALARVATDRPGAGPEAGVQRDLLDIVATRRPGWQHGGVKLDRTSAHTLPVDPDDVERAAERIVGRIRRTPVVEYGPLVLKLELMQHAGSFKTRGAFNRVLGEPSVPDAGLIAASGGNHGAALAYVGQALGVRTEIFIPATSPDIKRRNVERFGATARVIEGLYDDAQAAAEARQAETGALEIHPYDHAATVAGQGTMARELEQQVDGFDTIVVASGGGGFIAGQAAWLRDRVKVVNVEPETSQCVRAALAAGEPVTVDVGGVAADSLGAKRVGTVPWAVIREFVDEAVVVPDEAIRAAQIELWEAFRLVVEPGGAAALAAIRTGAYVPSADERVVVTVCGSNCDPSIFARVST